MTDMPVVSKAKSFWEKPEGKTGTFFAAGGILGALLIMAKWGSVIVDAARNSVVLGLYVLAAVAIGYVLMDKRFRAMVFYMYKGLMRFLTGLFIQIDPISILKTYLDDLKKNHADMDKQIGRLRGVMTELQRKIRENENNAKNNMALAAQAQKKLSAADGDIQQTMRAQVMLKTRKAGRLQETNRTFKELYVKIEMIYRVLSKMFTNCGVLIEDTEDSINLKETEWRTMKMAHGAMRSAMNIIRGDKDKRAIYEEALDIMANDLDTKVGEMQRFMEVSQNFLDGIDLQNGVFEEKGLEMLEKWEKDADSWLLGDDKGKIISDANNDAIVLDVNAPIDQIAAHANQYNQLFR